MKSDQFGEMQTDAPESMITLELTVLLERQQGYLNDEIRAAMRGTVTTPSSQYIKNLCASD